MKICTKCKFELSESDFYKDKQKKDGLSSHCKDCNNATRRRYNELHKEERKKYMNEYYSSSEMKIKRRISYKKYSEKNKDKIVERGIKYREENKDKEKIRKRKYYMENREIIFNKQNEYRRKRLKANVVFKLTTVLRDRLHTAMRNLSFIKNESTLELIGCSIHSLKIYLESKFQEGMSWKNYGYYGWHIDHIIPCASFDLTDPEQQKLCFHYTNLQPLWAKDNFSKGSKY